MITKGLYTSNTDEWATPAALFSSLDAEFHFDLDPCATEHNAKCREYFDKDTDGLSKKWGGAEGVLQPAVRPRHQVLGPEMLGGITQPRNPRRRTPSRPYRYGMVSRLHLPQGEGNPVRPWAPPFQRIPELRPVSVHDRNILAI